MSLLHVFHISRVWGSQHGGSIYSRVMVEALLRKGWRVTLMAEEFWDGNGMCALGEAPDTTNGNESVSGTTQVQRVRLPAFFKRTVSTSPGKLAEVWKIWRLITETPNAMVIVQGDLPRVVYLLLQLRVPLLFVRQDGILACPGNNRFLQRSRSICRKRLGLSCLLVHRKEGCLGPLSLPRQLGRLAFRFRDSLLLRCIGNFVAISRYIAQVHRKPERVLYPPRLAGAETRIAPERDLQRLIFCGRLEAVKGPADAVQILSLLPDGFRLEILGDGPERGRLGSLVEELDIAGRVRFHSWVDPVTRDTLLASAGVLLMPSLWDEAFGMAGIEAMAQGTPVVAYDVGGISEWCSKQCGLVIPCGHVQAAASAVRQITEQPTRWAAYSQAAKRFAEDQFPAWRFALELEALLQEVRNRFPRFAESPSRC